MKIHRNPIEEAFTAKSKASGKVVNFASQQNRDNAIKSGEYEETDDAGEEPAAAKPKVNIFDKPKPQAQPAADTDGDSKPSSMVAPTVVKTPVDVLKSKVEKWSEKEKAFFRDGIHKEDSPERRNWKDAIKDKAKGAIAAIKKGAKHEVEEFKAAGAGVKNFFSGKELSEHEKKALKAVAIKVATTAIFGAVTGGAGHGVLAFGKHVAMEFIPHVVGETILKGAGTAALFAGDEEEDVYMERFMAIIADKMANEKITPELMTQMVDSYNAKKGEGDSVNEESELKGYLAADVVDDIVKTIGSKMVKGHVENAPNRNYIYLKLTDIKFGNDVVKMLKSKFGIDAKIDKTFGNIPTISFPSKKVISESVNKLTNKEKRIKDGNPNNVFYAFYKGQFDVVYWAMNPSDLFNIYWDEFKVRRPSGSKFKLNPEFIIVPKKEYDKNPNQYSKLKPYVDKFWDKLQAESVNEEISQLTADQSEMVNGIIEMLLQIKDIDNRMEVAQQQIQNFKDEDIDFNYAGFLSAAGLDNNDEPIRMNTKTMPQHILNKESIMNEEFKHLIHVDTPTQVVSKPVAAQIMALAKKGVRSKDIGLEMGFVGNAKLAADTFQKVKNKIYFELGKKFEAVNVKVEGTEPESSEETLESLKKMAMGDLERIEDYAEMISDRMKEGQELSAWMYSQITLAVDQLNSVHDTMDGKDGIKESVNEAKYIEPNDDWGVRLVVAINNNVSSLHTSVMREKQDINKAVDAFGTMLKNAIKETLKHKYKPHPKAKDADSKIKTFISELKKFEKIVDMVIAKPTKIGITKLDDAWRSIWNHKYGAEIGLSGELFNSLIEGKVNEVKYPTDLKVGSVIMGQGFTMLKGIEGGKYYKIIDMDDTTATLIPSDKNGNTKGSSKVRHKLDSIEGGIKTAKRGDENGIVVIKESVNEEKPGLWANIRAKRARGEEPAHGNSDAHKDAVKAGKEINDESVTEAMGNDKSMLALVDILSNSMEYYEDDSDFLQAVRGGQGWSGIPGFKNSSLIPVFKSIYKKYWTVSPQNRTNWVTKDWMNWLKPFGLEENVNSETDTIDETTLNEKQFKGLDGIPSTTSLEKISKDQKLKIIKAPGNIIDFIVPKGVSRNFWQVIGTGKIQKNSGGNYVLLGKIIHSPAFKSMDDLIDGVNWKSMEDRRRFNESATVSTPGEQIQNLNNRLTKLRQDMAKAKSPEAKNVIQAKMKNALQKLSDKKKNLGIKKS
jgi:hypothetical protein